MSEELDEDGKMTLPVEAFDPETLQEREHVRKTLQLRTYRYLIHTIRKQITLRAVITAGVLVVVFGLIVYGYLIHNFNQSMFEYGVDRFGPLVNEIQTLMAQNDSWEVALLEQRLQTALGQPSDWAKGRFVYLAVYDVSKRKIAHAVNDSKLSLKEFQSRLNSSSDRFLPSGKLEFGRISGDPLHVQVTGAFPNNNGQYPGYLDAVFEVHPVVVARGLQTLLQTLLLVTAIVLFTSFILYPVTMLLVRRLTSVVVRLIFSHFEVLTVLSGAIAKRDNETCEHDFRVTLMAVRLAEVAGLDHDQIRKIFKGSLIHDVGKIGEPDTILLKEGPLTDEEFMEMKKHVLYGWEIICSSPWLIEGAEVVRYHHEKYDGSGYLERLAGNDIPLASRIFAIVDVFDALTTRRPYKQPLSLEQSLVILHNGRGTHFDPIFLDKFMEIAGQLYTDITENNVRQIKTELVRIASKYLIEYEGSICGTDC